MLVHSVQYERIVLKEYFFTHNSVPINIIEKYLNDLEMD